MCDIPASPTCTLPGWPVWCINIWSFRGRLLLRRSLRQPAAVPALPPVGGTDTPSSCFLYQLLGCCNSISEVLMTRIFHSRSFFARNSFPCWLHRALLEVGGRTRIWERCINSTGRESSCHRLSLQLRRANGS